MRVCILFPIAQSFRFSPYYETFFLLCSCKPQPLRSASMSLSTFGVLLALTFGEIAFLTCGVLVLWLAGEIGDRAEPPMNHPVESLPGQRPAIAKIIVSISILARRII
jgi:hypothetical protein